jgi:glycosyltransferase involved in cell wall biosynthesis
VKVSIVMATYNRSALLAPVLESIRRQRPSVEYELIVVDDGSEDQTKSVCEFYGVLYSYLHRPYYSNPAAARNVGYRAAKGEVIIAQSSDVRHDSEDAIERLAQCEPRTFQIATVTALREDGSFWQFYTHGTENPRPFFFLGSLLRKDLYAIGGDDEDFKALGCEDDWFADRLIHGRGCRPVYRADVHATHLWHDRPKAHWDDRFQEARATLQSKREMAMQNGTWVAAGGAW